MFRKVGALLRGSPQRCWLPQRPASGTHSRQSRRLRFMASRCALHCQEVAREAAARPTLPRSGACAAALEGGQEMLMFGGYTEEAGSKRRQASNELWAFSLGEGRWRRVEVDPSSPAPGPRLVGQAVVLGSTLWVLGGWDPGDKGDGGDILGDIWSLDLGGRGAGALPRWRQVTPAGGPMAPASRFQACAVGGRVYIHTHRCVGEVLVLEGGSEAPLLRTLRVEPDPQHGAPPSRGLHSMTAVGEKLFLFGGAPQRGPMLDDLWELDLKPHTAAAAASGSSSEPLRWRALHPAGERPGPRAAHAAAALGRGQLLVVGGARYAAPEGSGGLEGLGDAWVLDTERVAWQQVQASAPGGGGKGALPSPRNAAVAAVVGGKMVLHGGWLPFRETYNDTFVLQLGGTVEE